MPQRVVVTGGPGSGKTTVLNVLSEAGYTTREDAARQIIRQRKQAGLSPRPEPAEFAQQILEREIDCYNRPGTSPIFYERGVADAAAFVLDAGALEEHQAQVLVQQYAYDSVFLLPPWEAIYRTDEERDHSFEHAVSVYQTTKRWYMKYYPGLVEVPKAPEKLRAEFILDRLGEG